MSSINREQHLKYLLDNASSYANPTNIESCLDAVIEEVENDHRCLDKDAAVRDFCIRETMHGRPVLGGGFMSTVLKAHHGVYDRFSNPAKAVRQKLFLEIEEVDDNSKALMARGLALEPIIKDMYLSLTGFTEDTAAMEHYKEFIANGGHPDYPHLAGNPDLFVKDKDGNRWLIDLKNIGDSTRIEKWIVDRGRDNDYEAQLATYKTVSELSGLKVNGVRLGALGNDNWTIYDVPVHIAEGTKELILELSNKYGKMIEENVIPTLKFKSDKEIIEDITPALRADIQAYTYADAIAKEAKKEQDNVKERIITRLEGSGVDLVAGTSEVASLKVKRNTSRAVKKDAILKCLGDMLIQNEVISEDELVQLMKSEQFLGNPTLNPSVTLVTNKKHPEFNEVQGVKLFAEADFVSIKEKFESGTKALEEEDELTSMFDAALSEDNDQDNDPRPF